MHTHYRTDMNKLMKSTIRIEPASLDAVPAMATVVAKAMLTNPLHIAVFKSTNDKSLRMQIQLFELLLNEPHCNLVVAKHEERIVGVMNYYQPGKCQISPLRTLQMLPALTGILGRRLPAALKWKSAWGKQDPVRPHLHFGPLAVLPGFQNMGIGSALLQEFCSIADAQALNAYLETDKEENLYLYQKFGFRITQSETVCGVKNWFMWREAFRVP